MKKTILRISVIVILLFGNNFLSMAQYSNDFAMRSYNLFYENPAYAGAADLYNLSTSFRKQWTGITGSPERYYLTFNMPFQRKHVLASKNPKTKAPHHGAGFKLENNKIGFVNGIALQACYAYHIPVLRKFMLAAGIGVGFQNYSINSSQLNFVFTDTDPVINSFNHFTPTGEVGLNLYSNKFFVSGALRQLASNGYTFSSNAISLYTQSRQFVTAVGCSLNVAPKVTMVPVLLNRSNFETPITTEAVLNFDFNKLFYCGLGYRHHIAVSINAGFRILDALDFLYSYDYTTSQLSGTNGGSHEILLRLHKPTPIKVDYPSDYW